MTSSCVGQTGTFDCASLVVRELDVCSFDRSSRNYSSRRVTFLKAVLFFFF